MIKYNYKIVSLKNMLTCILLFICSLFVFTLHDNFYATTDSLPNNYTAVNLIYNRSINLNSIADEIDKHGLMGVTSKSKNGDIFPKTPVLNGILASPFYLFFDKLNHINTFNSNLLFNDYYQIVGKYYGSFISSITVSLFFLSLIILFKNYKRSLITTFIYAFSTFTYGTVSQGNWEHAPSFLFYVISLISLILYFNKNNFSYLISTTIFIAFSYFLRPLNIVFIIALVMTLLFGKKIKHTLYTVLVFLFIYIIYTLISQYIGIPNGYKNEITDSITHINIIYSAKVLINILFSPNYGLFTFYPVFIFSLLGLLLFIFKFKTTQLNTEKYILIYSLLIIFAIFFLDTIWWAWPGGYSWGPRLLSEATIPMMFFIVYFLQKIKPNLIIYFSLFITSIYGIFSNILCIYANNTEWHALYMGAPSKYLISSWSKPQIIPFYLFERRALRTQELKHNINGESYFQQKTYLIEYKNKRILPVHESNILLYTRN